MRTPVQTHLGRLCVCVCVCVYVYDWIKYVYAVCVCVCVHEQWQVVNIYSRGTVYTDIHRHSHAYTKIYVHIHDCTNSNTTETYTCIVHSEYMSLKLAYAHTLAYKQGCVAIIDYDAHPTCIHTYTEIHLLSLLDNHTHTDTHITCTHTHTHTHTDTLTHWHTHTHTHTPRR